MNKNFKEFVISRIEESEGWSCVLDDIGVEVDELRDYNKVGYVIQEALVHDCHCIKEMHNIGDFVPPCKDSNFYFCVNCMHDFYKHEYEKTL